MNKYSEAIKGFSHFGGAWNTAGTVFAPGIRDSVSFGFYLPDGSTLGEGHVRWHGLDEDVPTVILEISIEAWGAFTHLPEVMSALLQVDPRLSPEDFCAVLRERGFSDRTQRVNPNTVRHFRITTRYSEDGKPDCVKEFEGVPEWAQAYKDMLTAPNFIKLTVSFETTQTLIERIQE